MRHALLNKSALTLVTVLVVNAQPPTAASLHISPAPLAIFNTSAPSINASVTTVAPPETLTSSLVVTNITFSSVGLDVAAASAQFNATIPLQAANTTVPAVKTVSTSVASLLPSNATQSISKANNSTLLVADPTWGKAIVVNASSLTSTKLVLSNATDLGATVAFQTAYNTTTVPC